MKDLIVIGGEATLENLVDGEFDIELAIDGSPGSFMPIMPNAYMGSYEFEASDTAQTISVEGKTMLHDIVIDPVPSNYGKITWNGSTLLVS